MTQENKLHKWEDKFKHLCLVNLQKNCPVYHLDTEKKDTLYSMTRIYEADNVDKIIEVLIERYRNALNSCGYSKHDIEKLEEQFGIK